jgi:hypothetical protein
VRRRRTARRTRRVRIRRSRIRIRGVGVRLMCRLLAGLCPCGFAAQRGVCWELLLLWVGCFEERNRRGECGCMTHGSGVTGVRFGKGRCTIPVRLALAVRFVALRRHFGFFFCTIPTSRF